MSEEHLLLVEDPDGIQTGDLIIRLKGGHYTAKDDHLEQPGDTTVPGETMVKPCGSTFQLGLLTLQQRAIPAFCHLFIFS